MDNNQIKYIRDYNKNNYKMYQFRVKKNDEELINHLDSMEKRNSYIISLIEKDIDVYPLKTIKSIVKPILKKHGIEDIYLFGSYARGEANKDSDIDIYCDKGTVLTLIDQEMLEEELVKALNKDVDLVFIGSEMDEFFRQQLMEDLIKLC